MRSRASTAVPPTRHPAPEAAVALEALRCEVTVEELHHQLREHGALGRVTTSASPQCLSHVTQLAVNGRKPAPLERSNTTALLVFWASYRQASIANLGGLMVFGAA